MQQPYILVVDDDADIRESFCDILTEEGYTVLTAGDGEEALSVLLSTPDPPGLFVIDVMMPRCNGWEVVEVLQRSVKLVAVPVVIISAHFGWPPESAVAWMKKPI